jgi:Tfp pilus assembly protein FimT
MTIIEVLFAVVILSGVMLALSRFGQGFARANRNSAYLTIASDLATARLEAIRAHGSYGTIVSTFNNTTETSATTGANPSMTGYPGYTRRTRARATVTDSTEFVTVTVTVTSPNLSSPMTKTVVIGAF